MSELDRRKFLKNIGRGVGVCACGSLGFFLKEKASRNQLYQINNDHCSACGKCEIYCVKPGSAVKCVNDYEACGNCLYCYGYFTDELENVEIKDDVSEEEMKDFLIKAKDKKYHICPYEALQRTLVASQNGMRAYEYTIDEEKCTGCGKCVVPCEEQGHGSLHLVIRRDQCLECNSCSIAMKCPENAIERIYPKWEK